MTHYYWASIVLHADVCRRRMSSVTLPAGRPADRRRVGTRHGNAAGGRVDGWRAGGCAHGQSGGQHCTAGQYGYVPLRRHLVHLIIN